MNTHDIDYEQHMALFVVLLEIPAILVGIVLAKGISKQIQWSVVAPLCFAVIGTFIGSALGLSVGGTTILATLFASASYIAVPAAMRVSVPEANPTLSLTASLGITFPFNIILGIPIYYWLANNVQSNFFT